MSGRSAAAIQDSARSLANRNLTKDDTPPNGQASTSQIDAIRSLCRRHAADPDALSKDKFNVEALTDLTHMQAGEVIRELNGRPAARTTTTV